MNYEFFTKRMPIHSGMTELNHLGASLKARPEKLEGVVTELFATKLYSDNPLTNMLMKGKRVKEIGTSAWSYELIGGVCRPSTVLSSTYTTNSTAGRGRTIITLDFDFGGYLPGDVLAPGGADKKYQCRIVGHPEKIGSRHRIRLQPMNDALAHYIPYQYLKAGALWGKLFSQYEEASDESGSTSYNTSIGLTGSMSRYRKMYKVTGDAAQEMLAIKIRAKSPEGKIVESDSWVRYAEIVYWQQWYRELERGLWYSRKTTKILGSNGRPIMSGAGLQQQLESGVRHYYNRLSADLLQEFIMDTRYGRIAPGQNSTIYAYTGEYGMLTFANAINSKAGKDPVFTMLTDKFVRDASSPYTNHGLSYGAQFVEYVMPNGVTLKLIHNPVYDDPEINFEIDPLTGKPTESMRFTFLDVAGEGSDANMMMINKKGGFKNWYVGGGESPYGAVSSGALGAHSGDYYEMHVLKQCGIHLSDPTKCGELILQRS